MKYQVIIITAHNTSAVQVADEEAAKNLKKEILNTLDPEPVVYIQPLPDPSQLMIPIPGRRPLS